MTPHATPPTPNGQVPLAMPLAALADAHEGEIPVANIDTPRNARTWFDPEQLQALQDNIAANGLLNPPIVYLDPASGRYALIAGERRLRCIKALGWTTVRARIFKEPPDEAKLRELALIDNVTRQDLSDIELGLDCQDHILRTGISARQLAQKLGKSVSTLTRAIQLAQKLPLDLIERIRAGNLPPSVARELLALPDQAKREIASQYPDRLKTRGDVIAAVKAAKNGKATGSAGSASFTCQETGVRIDVTLPADGSLAHAAAALKVVIEDLRKHGNRGLEHWKTFLGKKAVAAKKAAELQAAQNALSGLANPPPASPG